MVICNLVAVFIFLILSLLPASAADRPKPKVRAITGFITIDARSYPAQIAETVKFLGSVRNAIQAAGYEVEGIRISTQPFPEYTRGLSRADALKLLKGIDELSAHAAFQSQHRSRDAER